MKQKFNIYDITKNKNFRNNQNYVTIWTDNWLVNYYFFNTRKTFTNYMKMSYFLNKKIRQFINITAIFSLTIAINFLFILAWHKIFLLKASIF